MPVALGPVIKDPFYVGLQIVFLYSAFGLLLGAAIVVTGLLQLDERVTQPNLELLFGGFPSTFLHVPSVLAQSIVFGYVLANCVERRRLCLDFVVTVYIVYAVSCFAVGGIPRTSTWWATTVLGAGCALVVARFQTHRNEMLEVELSPIVTV
jgi:hypothetical protein